MGAVSTSIPEKCKKGKIASGVSQGEGRKWPSHSKSVTDEKSGENKLLVKTGKNRDRAFYPDGEGDTGHCIRH